MSVWNSNQYIKFENERTMPSVDLINKIPIQPNTVLDIGCGPGNSTSKLFRKYPAARVIGIDSSENMLEKARKSYPEINFAECDIQTELDKLGAYDLVFSNACLQWVPDHRKLLPDLMNKVNENGVLAVQVPLVQQAPFYKILDSLTIKDKWKKLQSVSNFHTLSPEETYDILCGASTDIQMWETVYYHPVSSYEDIIEWYKGTGLRPYLDMLNEFEMDDFVYELINGLKSQINVNSDGKIILKMPRLFFIATK